MFRNVVSHSTNCSVDAMRYVFPLFTAFVALQWTAAEPASTSAGNRTVNDPLDKPVLASHLKIDESDTPRILGVRDPTNSEDDHVHPHNEERGFRPSVTSTLADMKSVVSRIPKLIRPRRNTDPSGALVKKNALPKKLREAISHLQSQVDRGPTSTADAAVQPMGIIDKKTKRSMATLIRSRDVDGMHHIAHDLLRALAVKYKDAAKLVLDACRKACVHPEEVFYMLPISEELFTFGLREPARYSEIDEHLDLFLQYSEDFFTQQMKTAGVTRDERLQTYLNNVYESESFVVNTLMTEAIPENVVAYFEYLRGKEHLRHFAEKADRMLLAKYRDVTESLILNTWAEAGVEPHVAIKMMPWSDLNPLQYRATMGSSVEIDICERFKQVMKYVRLYREHREFDDYAVAKLLHGSVPIEELWAYIMVFQRYRGEDELPYQLMKAFERIFETSAQEMELAIAIENKLLQGHTPWSSIPT